MATRADIDMALSNDRYLGLYRHIANRLESTLMNPKKIRRAELRIHRPHRCGSEDCIYTKVTPIPNWGSMRHFEFELRDIGLSEMERSKISTAIICDERNEFLKGVARYLHARFEHLSTSLNIGFVHRNPQTMTVTRLAIFNGREGEILKHNEYRTFAMHPFKIVIIVVDGSTDPHFG